MSMLLTDKYLKSVIKKPEKIRVSATHPVPMYGVKNEQGKSIPFEMRYTLSKGTSQKVFSLGSYPKKSLASITERAIWARNLIAEGKDPKEAKLIEEMGLNKDDSFSRICWEYFEQEWN